MFLLLLEYVIRIPDMIAMIWIIKEIKIAPPKKWDEFCEYMIQLKSDFNYHMQIRINKFSYHYLGKGNLGQTPAFSSVVRSHLSQYKVVQFICVLTYF